MKQFAMSPPRWIMPGLLVVVAVMGLDARGDPGPGQVAGRGAAPPQVGPPPAGRSGQQLPPEPVVTTGLIVGRVVDAATGKPVPGATVTLAGGVPQAPVQVPPGTPRPAASPPPPPPRFLTDAEGRFAFRHLTRGTFNISASKPGYADGAYGRFRPNGPSRPIQLADHERVGEITLRLFKFAVVSGTVVDESGEPVVNTQVRAFRRALQAGRRVLTPSGGTAATDDRGVYRFAGLLPGEYAISIPMVTTSVPASFNNDGRNLNLQLTQNTGFNFSFVGGGGGRQVTPDGRFLLQSGSSPGAGGLTALVGAGGSLLAYPTQYYSMAATVAQATILKVASGEERSGVDFVLRLVPTANISGMLTGPEGPGGNYVLHLVPAESDSLSFDQDVATAVTDDTGAFMFLAVPAGQYVVQTARTPEPAPPPPPPPPPGSTSRTEQTTDPGGRTIVTTTTIGPTGAVLNVDRRMVSPPMLWTAAPVALGGTDLDGVTLVLREGLKISGRVEFVGAAERPPASRLAQVPVVIEPADARQRGGFQQPGRLNPDGTFTLGGLLPGRYLVRVGGAPGGWTMQSAMLNGVDVSDVPLELGERDVTGVVVTFTDRIAELRGTVRGLKPDAEPPAVLLFPADSTSWRQFGINPRRMRLNRASPTGQFAFGAVPSGDYFLVAIPDEYSGEWMDPVYLDLLSRTAARITIGEGERKTYDADLSDVRPPGGGAPVPAVFPALSLPPVAAVDDTDAQRDTNPASGPFVPEQVLAPPVQGRDRAVPDRVGTAVITGTVLDEGTNRPVRRVRVSVRCPEMRNERVEMTDDAGRFAITRLPPGQCTVSASKPAYLTGYHGAMRPGRGPGVPITLVEGQTVAGLAVMVARGGVISGVVLDQFGQPYVGGRIRLFLYQRRDGERVLVGAGGSGTLTTDDRGVYRVYGLMPGSYVIGVTPASPAGGTSETRQLSDSDMRAALADLARRDTPPPLAPGTGTPAAGPNAGRPMAPAPPGPPPAVPLAGRAVGLATVYYPGTVFDTDAGAVTVAAGQEAAGVDFTMLLVPTSRVEGVVLMPDGQPASRVQVQLSSFQGTSMSNTTVRVQPDGKFQAIGVAPGRYSLIARLTPAPASPPPPPVAGPPGFGVSPAQSPGLAYWAQHDLALNGDDATGLVLTLAPAMTLTGRMAFDSQAGTRQPPPSSVRINLETVGPSRTGYSPRAVQADESGVFTVSGITPGRYRLNAFAQTSGPNDPGWVVRSALVDGREAYDRPVEIPGGRNIQGAVITLTDRVTELSGSITDAAGAPAVGLQIVLFPTDRTYWTTSSRRMRGPTRPGPDGTYRVGNLLPGEYYLAAVRELEPGDWGDPAFMEQIAAVALKLTFVEGEKKVQHLRTGG